MKKTVNKLRSRRGETLAEILVAMLIVGLAAFLVVSMYSASSTIDMNTREYDGEFYDAVTKLETKDIAVKQTDPTDPTGPAGNVKIEVTGSPAITIDVDIYADAEKGLTSYALPSP